MTDGSRGHVLLVGLTTRALAVSAAKAGFRVTAVDGFGDLDLRAVAEVIPAPRTFGRFRPRAAAAAATVSPAPQVAYTSNLENDPPAVDLLSQGRRLLGNRPEVLMRVRNPIDLFRVLRAEGFIAPETRGSPPPRSPGRSHWLLKPRRSGGGHGIRIWHPGEPVPRNSYLQQRIPGLPGSILFVADGCRAVTLGLSRQLVGTPRLGASGFRYCGSLLATPAIPLFPNQDQLLERAVALVATVAREFGLVGLNGIDFIARDGVPYPIEVNPRYSASMELIERNAGLSLFDVHARAAAGELVQPPVLSERVHGKVIVFARHDVRLGDTRGWVGRSSLADVPHSGETILRGHPICTLLAEARTGPACLRLLLQRAAGLYRAVESRRRRAA